MLSRNGLVVAAAALLLIATATPASAAAGDLDRSFSHNGRVFAKISHTNDEAFGVAIQIDGRIVVAGTANAGFSDTDVGMVRYLPDGRQDPSFGHHGAVRTDLGGAETVADVALQTDGRIVVVGTASRDVMVARYRSNGSPDRGFGSNGIVRTDLGKFDDASSVAVQPDGRLVVTGMTSNGTAGRWFVARYLQEGELDPAFADGGIRLGSRRSGFAPDDVALRSDGRILVAGRTFPPGIVEVRRLLRNGRTDEAFGTNGRTRTPVSSGMRAAIALRHGEMFVTGAVPGAGSDFGIAALTANGTLDAAFGDGGVTSVDFSGSSDQADAIVIDADGNLIVGGDTIGSTFRLFALTRLLPDGSIDASFGRDGRVTTGGGELGFTEDLTVDASGRIVLTGVGSPGGRLAFATLRYLST